MAAPYKVVDAMVTCGVNNAIIFNGATQAKRITTDVFNDGHNSMIDKTYTELQEDLKAYSSLMVANGHIILTPGITRNIRAYI